MNHRQIAVLVLVCVTALDSAHAQIPRTLSYQGVLTDSGGTPKPDGSYQFTFRLYQASSGGGVVGTQQQTLNVRRGLFHTVLDQLLTGVNVDRPYWMSLQVGSEAELSPRIPLSSTLYSISSIRSDTALYALTAPQQAFVDSARIAGTVPNNSISTAKLLDNAVTSSKILDGTIQRADVVSNFKAPRADTADYALVGTVSGNAGGDLSGSYPNPTIATGAVSAAKLADNSVTSPKISNGAVTSGKINQSGAMTGQVLKWTGTTWAPATDSIGVAGSGAQNTIPKFMSGTTIGSSEIYEVGGRVGIGAPSVGSRLEVVSGLRAADLGTGYSPPASGMGVEIGMNGGGFIASYDRSALALRTLDIDAGPLMLNRTNGQSVGIGRVPSASYKLDVNGIVNATDIYKNGSPFTASLSLPFNGNGSNGAGGVFEVTNMAGPGVEVSGIRGTGFFGVLGQPTHPAGAGVYGWATSDGSGVSGRTETATGYAVVGVAASLTGESHALYGLASSSSARAVKGVAEASSGTTYGVWGESNSTGGFGVYGLASASTGMNYGVFGQSNSPGGYAGFFSGKVHVSDRIGVGTTSPMATMETRTGTNQYSYAHTDGTIRLATYLNGSYNSGMIGTESNNPFQIYTSNQGPVMTFSTGGTNGRVGIGTVTPAYKLDVIGIINATDIYKNGAPLSGLALPFNGSASNDVGPVFRAANTFGSGAADGVWGESASTFGFGVVGMSGYIGVAAAGPQRAGYFQGNLEYTGSLIASSDARLKQNVRPLTGALQKIVQLKPRTYTLRTDSEFRHLHLAEGTQYGLIAQELEAVLPDLVVDSEHRFLSPQDSGERKAVSYKAVKYVELIPVLIQAVKEQQEIIEELKSEVEKLKKR